MIIQGSHAPCPIPYHTFFPNRMLIGKLMYPLRLSKTYPSFLNLKEGSTFLTKPLFPQEREDVAGDAIALPEFWSASGACAFVLKTSFNSLYDPFGSPCRGQKPSLPLKKAPPLISVFFNGLYTPFGSPVRRKDVTALQCYICPTCLQ